MLCANECGSSNFVVEASLIRVPHEHWNDEHEEDRAHEWSPDANPPTAELDDPQAKNTVTDRSANRGNKQHLHDRKDGARDESFHEFRHGKQHADHECAEPVEQDRADPSPDPANGKLPLVRKPKTLPGPLARFEVSKLVRVLRLCHVLHSTERPTPCL